MQLANDTDALFSEYGSTRTASSIAGVAVTSSVGTGSLGIAASAAELCVGTALNSSDVAVSATSEGVACAAEWDGRLCWKNAAPGEVVAMFCPEGRFFNSSYMVERSCSTHGVWSIAKYEACFEQAYYDYIHTLQGHLSTLNRISLIGYSSSLFLLILAFFLLTSLKRLRCARNKLHLHLSASFILRCTVLVFKHLYFTRGITSFNSHEFISCRIFTLSFHYSLMANYCWILMEGLYLYNIIFMSVYADNSKIAKYIVMGWGLPLPWVAIWAIARLCYDNNRCWEMEPKYRGITWILRGPISLSIILNFFFFLSITRVLFVKMSAVHIPDARKVRYRKWFKSTLVLIPLFGAHQILTLAASLLHNDRMEFIWLYIDVAFTTFQGSVVALLYCFVNNEVQSEVIRLLPERFRRKLPLGDGGGFPSSTNFSKRDSLAPGVCTFKVHGKRRLLRQGSTQTCTVREEISLDNIQQLGNIRCQDKSNHKSGLSSNGDQKSKNNSNETKLLLSRGRPCSGREDVLDGGLHNDSCV
ncbi:secretin receptor-like isoform X2 [Varroa jacobsoni]|uniref:secretin receptor-like isoform X2 n=1 Tax=Varroa jacobsoni TaxID=62625 RepID=UPI000BF9DCDE|nr:secretin receptor-like isoform X2 [Varroa jacobsoni]